MAEKPSGPREPLDVKQIHYLVRLMKRYDLTALDLNGGPGPDPPETRGARGFLIVDGPDSPASHRAGRSRSAMPASRPEPPPASPPPASKTIVIESPMVGTYYTSSAPDAPPFVTIGSVVHPDTTVCIIEAMKVFTEIPAGVSGTIVEILAKNGQAVEFGQPLFRVTPA